jgi:hypothetical protein
MEPPALKVQEKEYLILIKLKVQAVTLELLMGYVNQIKPVAQEEQETEFSNY